MATYNSESSNNNNSSASALASAGAAIAGGVIQASGWRAARKWASKENEKMRQYNERMIEKQNKLAIDQWNAENAYNSPSAQMARYKAAGLNEDLIYGQSNASAASPSLSTPTYGSPQQFDNPLVGLGQSVAQAGEIMNQSAYQQAQIDLLKSQKNKTDKESGVLDIESKYLPQTLQNALREADDKHLLSEKEIAKINSELSQADMNYKIAEQNLEAIKLANKDKSNEIEYNKAMRQFEIETLPMLKRKMMSELYMTETQAQFFEKQIRQGIQKNELDIKMLQSALFNASMNNYLRSQNFKKEEKLYSMEIDNKTTLAEIASWKNARELPAVRQLSGKGYGDARDIPMKIYRDISYLFRDAFQTFGPLLQFVPKP